jgi:hypothetical protein
MDERGQTRKRWRYQRCNQMLQLEEGQIMQSSSAKGQKDKQRSRGLNRTLKIEIHGPF